MFNIDREYEHSLLVRLDITGLAGRSCVEIVYMDREGKARVHHRYWQPGTYRKDIFNYRSRLLIQAVEALAKMAEGGVMPSTSTWNLRHPGHLPSAAGLVWRLEKTWEELAGEAGLTMAPDAPPSPPSPSPTGIPRPSAWNSAQARRDLLEEVIYQARELAVDGCLPTQAEWDAARGDLPKAEDLTLLYGWDEGWAGLAWSAKLEVRRKKGAKAR